MDGHAGYPFTIDKQFFAQNLLHQVVDPDVLLGGDKQIWPAWMEQNVLHKTLGLVERSLRSLL